jgi:hypothetical protein
VVVALAGACDRADPSTEAGLSDAARTTTTSSVPAEPSGGPATSVTTAPSPSPTQPKTSGGGAPAVAEPAAADVAQLERDLDDLDQLLADLVAELDAD